MTSRLKKVINNKLPQEISRIIVDYSKNCNECSCCKKLRFYLNYKSLCRSCIKYKKYNATMRQDWELVKVDVMTKALKEKFTQDPYCKELLLSTGSKYLVENAGPRDCFWGNSVKNLKDPNKIGQLGILLMALRNELKAEKI